MIDIFARTVFEVLAILNLCCFPFLQTLQVAFRASCLDSDYFFKWLKTTSDDLQTLEQNAAPEGWECKWDRYASVSIYVWFTLVVKRSRYIVNELTAFLMIDHFIHSYYYYCNYILYYKQLLAMIVTINKFDVPPESRWLAKCRILLI